MSRRILTPAPNPHQPPPVSIATRRELFGTMGALLLLSAAEAGPAKAAELDGELLTCCAEFLVINAEGKRLLALCNALPDDITGHEPAYVAYDAHEAATVDQWGGLIDRISELPARTPEGLRAKVAVARSTVPIEKRRCPEPMDQLAWSVFGDMLGRARA